MFVGGAKGVDIAHCAFRGEEVVSCVSLTGEDVTDRDLLARAFPMRSMTRCREEMERDLRELYERRDPYRGLIKECEQHLPELLSETFDLYIDWIFEHEYGGRIDERIRQVGLLRSLEKDDQLLADFCQLSMN